MSISPGIVSNDGEEDNPHSGQGADDENTPFWTSNSDHGRSVLSPSNDSPTITFDPATLGTAGNPPVLGMNRIIMADEGFHSITWTTNDGTIHIQEATWEVEDEAGKGLMPIIGLKVAGIESEVPENGNDRTLELPITEFAPGKSFSKWSSSYMYVRLDWTLDPDGADPFPKSGSTRSGVFTVYNGQREDPGYYDTGTRLATEVNLFADARDGVDVDGNSANSPGTTISISISSTPVSTSDPTKSNADLLGFGNNSSHDSGGSLPAGAIAGIIVGAVLGLALVVFLVWLFFRRRRRAGGAPNGAYGAGHDPNDCLADKETQARIIESPQSPYTDDGQQEPPPQQQPQQQVQQVQHHPNNFDEDQEAALSTSAVNPTDHHSFAPYNEAEHRPIPSQSVDEMARAGARLSTQNANSNVSHLIEDGMSEAEIRRLEEEERALDAAIAQAGQGQQRRRQV